jgi:proteic killer suppression protein
VALPYIATPSTERKPLQRFFETGNPRGLSVQDDKRVSRILRALEAASRPEDMDLPGYRFHSLVGKDKGRYSVRVTGNWRITFGWDGENITDVDLEDYH